MTVREAYVGELGAGGALDWGGDPSRGNIARRMSPFFPAYGARIHPCELLHDWIKRGLIVGQKIDWGAVGARATVDQLQAFAEDCYGGDIPKDVAAFIAALDPSRPYALIGCEY